MNKKKRFAGVWGVIFLLMAMGCASPLVKSQPSSPVSTQAERPAKSKPYFWQPSGFSADGKWMALIVPLEGVQLWDMQKKTKEHFFPVPLAGEAICTVSADGKHLAVWGAFPQGSIVPVTLVFSIDTKQVVQRIQSPEQVVVHMQFSPLGKTLLLTHPYGWATLWPMDTKQALLSSPSITFGSADGSPIESAVFSPDGSHVLTAHQAKGVAIWKTESGQLVRFVTNEPAEKALFSPDGTQIVTLDKQSGLVRLWDAENPSIPGQLIARGGISIAYDSQGRYVAVLRNWLQREQTAEVFDIQKKSAKQSVFSLKFGYRVRDIAFFPHSNSVLAYNSSAFNGSKFAAVFDLPSGKQTHVFTVNRDEFQQIQWVADPSEKRQGRLFALHQDGHVREWDVKTGVVKQDLFDAQAEPPNHMWWLPQTGQLLMEKTRNTTLLDPKSNQTGMVDQSLLPSWFEPGPGESYRLLSRFVGKSNQFVRWEKDNTLTAIESCAPGNIWYIDRSPTRLNQFLWATDKEILLCRLDQNKLLKERAIYSITEFPKRSFIWDVLFSPDGNSVAILESSGKRVIVDLGTQKTKALENAAPEMSKVFWSGDSKTIFLQKKGEIVGWSAKTGKRVGSAKIGTASLSMGSSVAGASSLLSWHRDERKEETTVELWSSQSRLKSLWKKKYPVLVGLTPYFDTTGTVLFLVKGDTVFALDAKGLPLFELHSATYKAPTPTQVASSSDKAMARKSIKKQQK